MWNIKLLDMCLFVKAFSRQLFEYLFVSPDSLKKLFSLMSCWGRRNLINLMKVNLWQIPNNLCLLVNSALTAVHWVISLLAKSQFVVASIIGDKWVKFYKHRTNTVTNTDLLSTPQTPLKKNKKKLKFCWVFWIRNNFTNFSKPYQRKTWSTFSSLKILQMLY